MIFLQNLLASYKQLNGESHKETNAKLNKNIGFRSDYYKKKNFYEARSTPLWNTKTPISQKNSPSLQRYPTVVSESNQPKICTTTTGSLGTSSHENLSDVFVHEDVIPTSNSNADKAYHSTMLENIPNPEHQTSIKTVVQKETIPKSNIQCYPPKVLKAKYSSCMRETNTFALLDRNNIPSASSNENSTPTISASNKLEVQVNKVNNHETCQVDDKSSQHCKDESQVGTRNPIVSYPVHQKSQSFSPDHVNASFGCLTQKSPCDYCREIQVKPPESRRISEPQHASVETIQCKQTFDASIKSDLPVIMCGVTYRPLILPGSIKSLKIISIGDVTVQYLDLNRFLGRGGKIRLFLRMKQVKHTYEAYNLRSRFLIERRKRELICSGVSPTGHFPVLIHNGETFCETHVILRHLAKQLGEYGSTKIKEDYFADMLMEKLAYWTDDLIPAIKEALCGTIGNSIMLYLDRRLGYYTLIDLLLGKIRSMWLTPPNASNASGDKEFEWLPTWYDAAVVATLFDDMQLIAFLQETHQLISLLTQKDLVYKKNSNTSSKDNLLIDKNGRDIAREKFPMLFEYYLDVTNKPLVLEMFCESEIIRRNALRQFESTNDMGTNGLRSPSIPRVFGGNAMRSHSPTPNITQTVQIGASDCLQPYVSNDLPSFPLSCNHQVQAEQYNSSHPCRVSDSLTTTPKNYTTHALNTYDGTRHSTRKNGEGCYSRSPWQTNAKRTVARSEMQNETIPREPYSMAPVHCSNYEDHNCLLHGQKTPSSIVPSSKFGISSPRRNTSYVSTHLSLSTSHTGDIRNSNSHDSISSKTELTHESSPSLTDQEIIRTPPRPAAFSIFSAQCRSGTSCLHEGHHHHHHHPHSSLCYKPVDN